MGLKIDEEVRSYYYYGLSSITDLAYIIYDENGTEWANGNMAELGTTGLYYKDWIPDAAGVWIFRITKGTVKDAFVYHVGQGQEADIEVTLAEIVTAIGADFDGSPSMYKALITGGIPVWPSAAVPGNNIAIAQVLRQVYDEVAGVGGSIADIATQIGVDFDGTPSMYTALITGYTDTVTAVTVGAMLERLQLLQEVLLSANTMFVSSAATVNTVTCTALVDRTDIYEGMMIVPLNGNQAGQGRYITNYNDSDLLTVVPDWSTDPDGAGAFRFAIVPSPVKFIYESGKGLEAVFDIVDGIPVLTRVAGLHDQSDAASTEDTVVIYDSPGANWEPTHFILDLTEMEAADDIDVKISYRMTSGGGYINETSENYSGVQAPKCKSYALLPNRFGIKVTITQTAGTKRDWYWEFYDK